MAEAQAARTAVVAELRKQGGGADAADAPGKPDALLRTAEDAASSKDEDIDQLPSPDSMESPVRARAAARADARAAPRDRNVGATGLNDTCTREACEPRPRPCPGTAARGSRAV